MEYIGNKKKQGSIVELLRDEIWQEIYLMAVR